MKSQQRGDGTNSAAPFRPHNTDWHPAMSTLQATSRSYVGGYVPGRATHASKHALNLANMLKSRQWGTTHLLHADPLDRSRHMRMAGMQDEDIQEYGDDGWNTATWHIRNRQHHRLSGTDEPVGYGIGPKDREKFDNDYD